MSSLPRGSEWRKWDLHVHTPDSRLNQGFSGDWPAYITALASSDIAVYGITNYFCFADGELEKVRKGLAERNAAKTVFGNLEFRISQANKDNEFINVHALFSDRLTTRDINDAVAHLKLINTADPKGTHPIYCCDADVRKARLDFSKILVSFHDLVEHLRRHFKRGDYLVACCPSGYGSFRPARENGRGNNLAIEIDKGCDLAFGNSEDREFFLKTDRYAGALQRPVVAGSDAHKIAELGRRFCWIKANPHFEGFRQILFEPEERVSLATDNPLLIYPKPSFSQIEAGGGIVQGEPLAFTSTTLPLNSGLVAIIGGRGTGKSVLLDCLYRQFHDISAKGDGSRLTQLVPEQFTVTFTKQGGAESVSYGEANEGAVTYLHVRQGDIRSLAENADALSDEIKRLLGIVAANAVDVFGLDLEAILEQIADIKRWLLLEDDQGNLVNSKPFNEKIIRTNEERIKAITSKENKELVERFNKNAAAITSLNRAQQRLVGLKAKLGQVVQDLGREISSINAVLGPYGQRIPEFDARPQTDAIAAAELKLSSELKALAEQNAQIQRQLKAQGIEQDPAGLLDKVSVFQKAITDARQKITDIDGRREALRELLERRRQVAAAIIESLLEEERRISEAFEQLKRGRDGWDARQKRLVHHLLTDVTITGEIVFDRDAFYDGLALALDGRKFRQAAGISQRDRLIAKLSVQTLGDFVRLLDGEPLIMGDDGIGINAEQFSRQREYFVPHEEYSFLDYLYLPQWQQRYLRVRALLKYKHKDPDRLSVGQRGTFYVCIKLATDPFGSPFVFDQPEDDLDNEFIVRELVPLFKEVKQYRQIIVATHNANLVVNADAEQIVVASNADEQLSYMAGALEEKAIRDAVCTILEGGPEAFLKRESKYGIAL